MNDQIKKPSLAEQSWPVKKPYSTPLLKDHGKVASLTLGPSTPGKGSKPTDGANGPHHP